MRHSLVLCSTLLLCFGTAGPGFAQGFPPGPPGRPPMGDSPMPGRMPSPMDAGNAPPYDGQPPMQRPLQGRPGAPGLGFNAQPPGVLGQGQPGQPQRQNYAEELTDFGVPPQDRMQRNVGSPTPTSIPGGHVITTAEIRQALGSSILMVNVLQEAYPTIPGAISIPGVGMAGTYDDEAQQALWAALGQATNMNPNQPIVFFCAGPRCWESYNASLRALQLGFKTVLWYRGGLAAWRASGGQLAQSGQD